MLVSASAKNIRISPEKVRLVVAQIKKMAPLQAVDVLSMVNKSSSPVLIKVVKSAIANAKNNYGLDENSLTFKGIQVTKGPMLKRFQPISRGRVHHILKRSSHITVVLESGEKKQAEQSKKEGEAQDSVKAEKQATKA